MSELRRCPGRGTDAPSPSSSRGDGQAIATTENEHSRHSLLASDGILLFVVSSGIMLGGFAALGFWVPQLLDLLTIHPMLALLQLVAALLLIGLGLAGLFATPFRRRSAAPTHLPPAARLSLAELLAATHDSVQRLPDGVRVSAQHIAGTTRHNTRAFSLSLTHTHIHAHTHTHAHKHTHTHTHAHKNTQTHTHTHTHTHILSLSHTHTHTFTHTRMHTHTQLDQLKGTAEVTA